MPLVQLIYISQPTGPIGSHELIQIVDSCRRNNEKSDITGMLAFSGEYFLQLIEGPEEAIAGTFGRIERDPRHAQIHVLARQCVAQRAFGTWNMGFAGINAFNDDLVTASLGTSEIDRDALGADKALALLTALSQRSGASRAAA